MAARRMTLPGSCLSTSSSRQWSASHHRACQWDDSRRWGLRVPPRQPVKWASRRRKKATPDHATLTIQQETAALHSSALRQHAQLDASPAVWQCIRAWCHPCSKPRHTAPIKYRHSRLNRGSVCGQQGLAANVQGRSSRVLGWAR